MNRRLLSFVSLFLVLALLSAVAPTQVRPLAAQTQSGFPGTKVASQDAAAPVSAATPTHASPVMFIENVGQFDEGARFQVRGGPGSAMWLAEDAIWLTLLEPETRGVPDPGQVRREPQPRKGAHAKLGFVGANPHPRIEPFGRLDTKVSYFLGHDPENWHPDVPVWGGIRYVDLYPGVDLEMSGLDGTMVQRLVPQPGANLSAVRLRVEGATAVALDGAMLRLRTSAGDIAFPLLQAEGFSGEAAVQARGALSFDISAPIAPAQPEARSRTIGSQSLDDNPADLLYATLLGGGEGYGITVDSIGNAYITGYTHSSDFPATPGAFDTGYNGMNDAFVVKLGPDRSELVYATFLGGSYFDYGYGIAVDSAGSAYVTGNTYSSDFPATLGAFDTSYNGGSADAFVVKLNPGGSELAYATFLGSGKEEYGRAITVNGMGSAYVTGDTNSPNFPTTSDAFDTSYNGPVDNYVGYFGDPFVAKLDPDGSGLAYATFLGGFWNDQGHGIDVDSAGSAYVTGYTCDSDFPTTPGAFDTSFNDGYTDAFVVKLDADGSGLSYATFLGSSSYDEGHGIAVDSTGSAYVTGYTSAGDFPATPGAFDTTFNDGAEDVFVVKLDADGSGLSYATFLGGSSFDNGYGIALDGTGSAFVTGYVYSSDFPVTSDAFDRSHNGGYTDTFVAKLDPIGSSLDYSTYLGGSDFDYGYGIAVDSSGSALVTGYTRSSDFPTTPDAIDWSHSGYDSFVGNLLVGGEPPPVVDLSIDSVEPIQSVEGQDLVKDKATAVKVVVSKTGDQPVDNVAVRVDYLSSSWTDFYVAEEHNMDGQHMLVHDSTHYPLDFAYNETSKTIYFFSEAFTPEGDSFLATATVDYIDAIPETNELNNETSSSPVPAYDTRWSGRLYPDLYLHYFRTDWDEPFELFSEHVDYSSAFLSSVLPVSEERFAPDHSLFFAGDTRDFRNWDNRLYSLELASWVAMTLAELWVVHPTADRFISVVPEGWFAATTTGQLAEAIGITYNSGRFPLVIAEARTSVSPNGAHVDAHEIGHSYGLARDCEEYEDCNPTRQDGIGNYAASGIWVERLLPIDPSSRNIYCFMGKTGKLNEYWIDAEDYSTLLENHQASEAANPAAEDLSSQAILATGLYNITGTLTLDNWYTLAEAEPDILEPGPYAFEYLDSHGSLLHQVPFTISFEIDIGAPLEDPVVNWVPFVFRLPYVPDVAQIAIKYEDSLLGVKAISPNAPQVTMVAPNGGEHVAGLVTVEWSASDADGDGMTFVLALSQDAGLSWEPIVGNLVETTYLWDASSLPAGSEYLLKVIATDGFNAAEDVSDSPFVICAGIYLPLILRNH